MSRHDNGTATTYSYDGASARLLSIVTRDPGLTNIQDKSYKYSAAGDIAEIIDAAGAGPVTYSYTYDKLRRLLSENNTGGVGDFSQAMLTKTFDDNAPFHAPKKIISGGSEYTLSHDPNGNMTTGYDFSDPGNVATRTIAYNADNLPTHIAYVKTGASATVDIYYDGENRRAKKAIQGGATSYYIGEHFEVIGGVETKYVFAGNLRVAKVSASGKHFFHKDHLGSSSVVTDGQSGAAIESTLYLPFGLTRKQTGANVSNYKFTDQEFDSESELYNYDARLYDPVVGRFILGDTIVPSPFNPQYLNRYNYVLNNPLVYVDPSGHHIGGDFGPRDYHDLDDNPGGGRGSMGISEDEYEREYILNHMSYHRKTGKFYYDDPNYGQRQVTSFDSDVEHFDWHKDRNVFNFTPLDEPIPYGDHYIDIHGNLWTREDSLLNKFFEGLFHGLSNRSYRGFGHANKNSQATYGLDGKLVDTGNKRGTFDYGDPPSFKHTELDVTTHIIDSNYTDPDLSFRY